MWTEGQSGEINCVFKLLLHAYSIAVCRKISQDLDKPPEIIAVILINQPTVCCINFNARNLFKIDLQTSSGKGMVHIKTERSDGHFRLSRKDFAVINDSVLFLTVPR